MPPHYHAYCKPRCALDQAEPNENEPTQTSQAYPETLRKAGPRMPVALRARSASLGRSNSPLEPLGLAGALDRTEPNENEPNQTGQAYSETLRRAGPRMPVALNSETNILRAWNARVRTIYIYIFSYELVSMS